MPESNTSMDRASTPDEDIPDMATKAWREKFDAAPVKRGRPRTQRPKISTTIRLDADVLDHFKAEGPGWQTRINETLRRAIEDA